MSYGDDLDYSAGAVADAVNTGAKILYISNPNNPTGNAFSTDELSRIVGQTSPSTLVVIDEAYYEYARRHDGFDSSLPVLDACERPYIVLRTFSKAYGLAGLRVGYGICYLSLPFIHPGAGNLKIARSSLWKGRVRFMLALRRDRSPLESLAGRVGKVTASRS